MAARPAASFACPEFAIWPSGAWPLLPPATCAQAQELAGRAFIEKVTESLLRARSRARDKSGSQNPTLAEKNETANAVAGGLKGRKAQLLLAKAQLFDSILLFLVAAAIVL